MKKIILILSLLICTSSLFCQTKTEKSKQYEYLVYSFGKTYFDSIDNTDPYFFILTKADVGSGLNEKLNILGRLGWELVDVVGAIGGDQEVIFIREKGVITPEKENELIEAIRKEQSDAREAYLNQMEKERKPDTPLIETDSRDWDIEYEKMKKTLESEILRVSDFVKTLDGVLEVKYNDYIYIPKLTIKCDYSKTLLRGKEYSLQEVKDATTKLYYQIRNEFDFDKFTYSFNSLDLDITICLSYEGKTYDIHNASYTIEKSYK